MEKQESTKNEQIHPRVRGQGRSPKRRSNTLRKKYTRVLQKLRTKTDKEAGEEKHESVKTTEAQLGPIVSSH